MEAKNVLLDQVYELLISAIKVAVDVTTLNNLQVYEVFQAVLFIFFNLKSNSI